MDLKIKLTADATAAERGVAAFSQRANRYVGSIGAELSSRLAGAFAAGAVIGAVQSFARSFVHAVDEVKDLSDQLGISTDEVQRLQKAANDAGVKFGVIGAALQKIDALKAQAASGDQNALGIFSALGIDPSSGSSLEILQRAVDASGNNAAALFDLVGSKASIIRNIVRELRAQGPIELISPGQIAAFDQAIAKLEESKRLAIVAGADPAAGLIGFIRRAIDTAKLPFQALAGFAEGGIGRSPSDEAKRRSLAQLSMFALMFQGGALLGDRFQASLSEALGLPPAASSAGGNGGSPGGGNPPPPPLASLSGVASPAFGRTSDALSRIGLFVGGAPGVAALRSIERNTAETSMALREANRILRMIYGEQQNGGV